MSALEWLKERQRQSLENKALFEARPRVAASQAWGGYADKPGGQRLMVRQPEVKNKLVEKRGNATLTKEWVSPYPQGESTLNVSAVPDHERTKMIPLPPNVYKRGFQPSPRTLSPGAQAAIAQVQSTGGRNVDAYGEPIGGGNRVRAPRTFKRGFQPSPSRPWSYARHQRPQQVRPQNPSPQSVRAGAGQAVMAPRVTDFQTNVVDRRSPTLPERPTQSSSYLEDWPLNENQWNTLTDQQFQNAGQGRNNYVFGDTTAPGVGSVPNKTLFSMGIPISDYGEWSEAQRRDEMLQEMIRRRLDPRTLRQPYQRSGGRY